MDKSRPKFLVKVLSGDRVVGRGVITARNATQATNDAMGALHPSIQISEVWVAREGADGLFEDASQTFPWSENLSADRIKKTTNFWLRLSVDVARTFRAVVPERYRSDFASKVLADALEKMKPPALENGHTAAVTEPEPVSRSKPLELEMS